MKLRRIRVRSHAAALLLLLALACTCRAASQQQQQQNAAVQPRIRPTQRELQLTRLARIRSRIIGELRKRAELLGGSRTDERPPSARQRQLVQLKLAYMELLDDAASNATISLGRALKWTNPRLGDAAAVAQALGPAPTEFAALEASLQRSGVRLQAVQHAWEALYAAAMEDQSNSNGGGGGGGGSSSVTTNDPEARNRQELLWQTVDEAVDELEAKLSGAAHLFDEFRAGNVADAGVELETVLRISGDADNDDAGGMQTREAQASRRDGGKSSNNISNGDGTQEGREGNRHHGALPEIVDSHEDRYVLTRPQDLSRFVEDRALVLSIVLLTVLGFALGFLLESVWKLCPALFGYIIAGVVLGPSCLDWIQHNVQVETVAQLGMTFIIFGLGREFSLGKVRTIWRLALAAGLGTIGALVLLVLGGTMLLAHAHVPPQEALMTGFIFSLSSTAVVAKLLQGDEARATEHGALIMAVLVLQDVVLSALLSVLPVLARAGGASAPAIAWELARTALKWGVLGIATFAVWYAMAKAAVSRPDALARVVQQTSPELRSLFLVSWCFAWMLVTDHYNLSGELGCFIAGVLLASVRLPHAPGTGGGSGGVEPGGTHHSSLRDFFGSLFFASIGLHINPLFLVRLAPLLVSVALLFMALKTAICYSILRFAQGQSAATSLLTGVALSQASEFAFVLGSRARAAGIISRDTYYLSVGAVSLTLIMTPPAWRICKLLTR